MSFEALRGNARLIAWLESIARSGNVPRSLLFTGPPGVGKLRAATTLAQALNCRISPGNACGTCPACVRIERGEYPDVRIARPEGAGGQIKVEAVRLIVSEMPFRPFEGRMRVGIVADADRLNPSAANTILKTLEEPPPWAVLVLVTPNLAALLPTLVSRCQIFRFAPLSTEEVADLLRREHDMSDSQARLLAALSQGSLSRALELNLEPFSDLREEAFRLAEIVAEGKPDRELVALSESLSKESRLQLLLNLLLGVVRDVATHLAGGVPVNVDRTADLDRLSAKAPLGVWIQAYSLVEAGLEDLRDRYLNKRITSGRLVHELNRLRGA